jgi:molybdopterin synthase sulfur carrier subunit
VSAVELRLPSTLADLAGGRRDLVLSPAPTTLAGLLDDLDEQLPAVARRIRDETGALRRYVNVYVDGDDARFLDGLGTVLRDGSLVEVIPSVAGG